VGGANDDENTIIKGEKKTQYDASRKEKSILGVRFAKTKKGKLN